MGLGKHLFADFYYCEKKSWENPMELSNLLLTACEDSGINTKNFVSYISTSNEISIIIISPGVHLAAYFLPEKEYLGLDIFALINKFFPEVIFEKLVGIFQPKVTSSEVILRGTHLIE